MKKVRLDKARCDSKPFCPAKGMCPEGAIEFKRTGFIFGDIVINDRKCIGCGRCVSVCPHGALSI